MSFAQVFWELNGKSIFPFARCGTTTLALSVTFGRQALSLGAGFCMVLDGFAD